MNSTNCPRCGQKFDDALPHCKMCGYPVRPDSVDETVLSAETEAQEVEKATYAIKQLNGKLFLSVIIGIFFCPALFYGLYKMTEYRPFKGMIHDTRLEETYVAAVKETKKLTVALCVLFGLWAGGILLLILF